MGKPVAHDDFKGGIWEEGSSFGRGETSQWHNHKTCKEV